MSRPISLVLTVLVASSCTPPPVITCSSNEDCAAGFACVAGSAGGECVPIAFRDGGDVDSPGAGGGDDAGRDGDGGSDAGPALDAGQAVDAGTDGGAVVDAGTDGGAVVDAGYDGGAVVDAGYDGGAVADAGYDGGAVVDAGYDAGPPRLQFVAFEGPTAPGSRQSLACAEGEVLWFRAEDGALYRSTAPGTGAWTSEPPASSLPGTDGGVTGSSSMHGANAAWVPSLDALIVGRWYDSGLGGVFDRDRLARFDVGAHAWSLITDDEPALIDTGYVLVGDFLFGVQKAGAGVHRVSVQDFGTGDLTWTTNLPDLDAHENGTWLSAAAKLALHKDGRVYGLKNDWTSTGGLSLGLLWSFDPDTWTTNPDFRFERLLDWGVGKGSALVAVPPGWAGVGPEGGLLILAGESPSDFEGAGADSDRAALWSPGSWRELTLPRAVGEGTAACFFDGSVYVTLGPSAATPRTMWRIRPVP